MKNLRHFNAVMILLLALLVTPLVKASDDDIFIRRPSNIASPASSASTDRDGSVLADAADFLGVVWSDLLLLIRRPSN